MRVRSFCAGLALLLGVIGCSQQCYVTKEDLDHTRASLLPNLEKVPDLSCKPMVEMEGPPMTLYNLDRPIRFISLNECIAIALEQGKVGQQSPTLPGTSLDSLVSFTGRGVAGSDAIRVLALDPASVGAGIEAALSKFDAVLTSSINWTTTDTPVSTPLQSFQASSSINAIQQEAATASVGLLKPLPTGGVAGITFNVPYTYSNLNARVNPVYQPQLQFQFEQPLLQGFGVEINQLRASHPGSILNPGVANLNPTTEGILITRLRFDQQRAEFERNVNFMLLNVEVAYWNLYGAYWTMYAREQGLRMAYESYRTYKAAFDAGRIASDVLYQSRGQYELFRTQRLQAIDAVLESERQLRALLGLPIEDCKRLMPCDQPTLAPYNPDYCEGEQEALTRRPELFMARQDVKAAQFNVILAKNSLLPDLRFTSTYDINSNGTRLDGADTNNAFRNLADNSFNSWAVGVRVNVPLGFRFAHANVRQAELALGRSLEVLRDQEQKAKDFLAREYRLLPSYYEQIRATRAQRQAYSEQLKSLFQNIEAGRLTTGATVLFDAQRFYSQALSDEYQAIVNYNNALAGWEFAKGSILQHDNVVIGEGPLPTCAQVRAVEHQKERTEALVGAERSKGKCGPCCGPVASGGPLPTTLPAMEMAMPPLKDVPSLPLPTGVTPVAPIQAAPKPIQGEKIPAPVEKPKGQKVPKQEKPEPKKPADLPEGTSASNWDGWPTKPTPAAPKKTDSPSGADISTSLKLSD
jgi:outer membrane protein TolC